MMSMSTPDLIREISKAVQQDIAPLIAKTEAFEHRTENLETLIEDTMGMSLAREGEADMAKRFRYEITTPTGEKAWLTGNSPDEAFQNGMKKYGMGLSAVPKTAPTIDEYGERWFKTYHKPHVKPIRRATLGFTWTSTFIRFLAVKPWMQSALMLCKPSLTKSSTLRIQRLRS